MATANVLHHRKPNAMVWPLKLTDGCSIRVPAPGAVLRFSPNPLVVSGPKFCDSGKFRFRFISSKDIWPAPQLVNVMSKSALLNKTHASQNFPHLELCFDSYRFLYCLVIFAWFRILCVILCIDSCAIVVCVLSGNVHYYSCVRRCVRLLCRSMCVWNNIILLLASAFYARARRVACLLR